MNEEELRTLLIKATADRPAGIDLMTAVARKPSRVRSLVPMLAAGGVAATVGATVLLLPGNQPSAQAQVATAVENTGSESYRIHVDAGIKKADGAIDPVRHVGELTGSGGTTDTRFVGDLMYVREPGAAKWTVYPRGESERKDVPPATALVKLAPQDPQAALRQLRSATDVRESGPASGPGWAGKRFTFSLKSEGPGSGKEQSTSSPATGSVDVDDQGRVRRLDITFADNGQRDVMDFSDFGIPVTVTAPPADEVQQPPADKPADKPKPTGEPTDRPTDKPTGKP
ncbi:hypothetical protein AB0M95_20155 [Sphaerisporangium sp. NPDC051017]|uniref:hypothetical protein n=1 Tax=Sphaerisporangium sp. NPDC051017 TaxID=3154636 RepID=UPI003424D01C